MRKVIEVKYDLNTGKTTEKVVASELTDKVAAKLVRQLNWDQNSNATDVAVAYQVKLPGGKGGARAPPCCPFYLERIYASRCVFPFRAF